MSDGSLRLYEAARAGDANMIRILLKQPTVDINYQGASGRTALHLAVQKGHYDVVRLLLRRGASTELRNLKGLTARDCAEDPDARAAFAKYDPDWKVQL